MRLLTEGERIVLREVGPPGEWAPGEAFASCEREGWGYWRGDDWIVTESGRNALAYDNAARGSTV